MGSTGGSSPGILLAFDFDHTVVDGNTDTHVITASPSGRLPDDIKSSYVTGRWTEYMQRVLAHLHETGVSVADMRRVMQTLPYTQGMQQLLQELSGGSISGQPASSIILSDSNTEFIKWILTSRGHQHIFRRGPGCECEHAHLVLISEARPCLVRLTNHVSTGRLASIADHSCQCLLLRSAMLLYTCSHIYTNPATVSPQGQLLVQPHHMHTCSACPVNMCKGQILQEHWQGLANGSQQGPRIVYVGDGGNDLCPAQGMGPEDILFVRAGYGLQKLLQDPAVRATVKARVHVWESAAEICNVLQQSV